MGRIKSMAVMNIRASRIRAIWAPSDDPAKAKMTPANAGFHGMRPSFANFPVVRRVHIQELSLFVAMELCTGIPAMI